MEMKLILQQVRKKEKITLLTTKNMNNMECPSSCKNPNSSEEEIVWPQEVMYAPTQDIHERLRDEEELITGLQGNFKDL